MRNFMSKLTQSIGLASQVLHIQAKIKNNKIAKFFTPLMINHDIIVFNRRKVIISTQSWKALKINDGPVTTMGNAMRNAVNNTFKPRYIPMRMLNQ